MNSGGSLSTHSIVRLEKMVIPYTLIARITLFQSPYIIAISGFGGAGKSTFASALGNAIDAPVIGVDSFMVDRNRPDYELWKIMDFDRLKREVLSPFLERKRVRYGHFDWETNAIGEVRELPLTECVIVEGVGQFSDLSDCIPQR